VRGGFSFGRLPSFGRLRSLRRNRDGETIVYAIVATGGKQYRVEPGQHLDVERLIGEPGSQVELPEVLLVADGDVVTVGQPTVPGARVVAELLDQAKGKKIIVFKYKSKVRYRRKTGHRQQISRLVVRDIVTA
jgi:large subunit ribosomal protein L21